MHIIFYIAASLLIAVAFAHSYLGERYILIRLFKRDSLPRLFGSDDFTKRTLRFAWHLTSIAWLGMAGIIVAMTQPDFDNMLVCRIIAVTFLIHFLIALFGSKGKHLSWIVFGLISLLLLSQSIT